MKTRLFCVTLAVLACLTISTWGAQMPAPQDPVQAYVDAVRGELSTGKVRLINETMDMSAEEAAVFWPLYHDYETELFVLGDRRLELIERFINAHQAEVLNDQESVNMAKEWFAEEMQRLELLQTYHRLMTEELSAAHAIQFVQIEHRINTVIDVMIASEMPLFREI